MKVRAGSTYKFVANGWDLFDSKLQVDVPDGALVKVVNLHGAPKANTMGQCYIEYGGKFAGMVSTNSLVPRAS